MGRATSGKKGSAVVDDYESFIDSKLQCGPAYGFDPIWMPEFLYPFQNTLVGWAIRKGRGALLEDTGLGKTPQFLTWAENVVRHTNRPVIVLTPIAVGAQTIKEAEKFGIEAVKAEKGMPLKPRIVVTNYERLHHFSPDDFSGVVLDEASAIKAFNGVRRAQVTEFMRTIHYRLPVTATAAPNDYIELGTLSEAIGEMGQTDMLGRFFKNEQNNVANNKRSRFMDGSKWRFKHHAERPFWKWVCSWARACRKPSDLGFDDGAFKLLPLIEREHVVKATKKAAGFLFDMPAHGLKEQRDERRRTINERCEKAAELAIADKTRPAVVWCHLNDEGDLLERLIPDCQQVSGRDSDESKEEKLMAFTSGKIRALVIKPKIGAWGLNWQHCSKVIEFVSHSFEQRYQAVRRCHRYGQTRPVEVDTVVSEGERGVVENYARKAAQFDRMFAELISFMDEAMKIEMENLYTKTVEQPSWA